MSLIGGKKSDAFVQAQICSEQLSASNNPNQHSGENLSQILQPVRSPFYELECLTHDK